MDPYVSSGVLHHIYQVTHRCNRKRSRFSWNIKLNIQVTWCRLYLFYLYRINSKNKERHLLPNLKHMHLCSRLYSMCAFRGYTGPTDLSHTGSQRRGVQGVRVEGLPRLLFKNREIYLLSVFYHSTYQWESTLMKVQRDPESNHVGSKINLDILLYRNALLFNPLNSLIKVW